MSYDPVTIAQFKDRFDRDFAYGASDDLTKIRDKDITLALNMATANFNECLWESQTVFGEAFLLLAAHFLVRNIRNSSAGLGSQFQGLVNSKSVGNVSESYTAPDKVLQDPFLASLYLTGYGAQYMGMLDTRIRGHILTIQGNSTP